MYILECAGGTLYTGATTDVERRFGDHLKKSARYTAYNPPVRVAYRETCRNRSAALRREAEIKRWTRAKKLNLIASSP